MSKSSVPPPIDRSKLKSFRDITNLSGRKTPQSARRYGIPRIPPNLIVKRIPEPSRDPFQLDEDQDRRNPNRQKQPTFKVMQIRRTKSSNIRGRRTLFVLYQYDHPIYSAKYKPIKISEYVPIFCGGEPHFKNQPQAVLLVANNNCDFSLRKDNKLGQELLTLQYRRFTTEGAHPRHLTAYFFGQNDDIPNKLENVDPEFRDDAWSVDLNTNEAMSSIKNCKLENDEHQPYVYIRKTQKEVLEIEIREEIDDMYVFALGISSFLCKK